MYIEAKVQELVDSEEIRLARRIKKERDMDAPDDFMGNAIRRVYKAEIQNGVFIRDYRVQVSLKDLKKIMTRQS